MEEPELKKRFITYLEGYRKLIIKIASSYCSGPEERRDLIQEISLQLWKAYPNYDSSVTLSTWTYRIALNVSISFLRKETSRKRREEQYHREHDILAWQDPGLDERLEQLYRSIERLRPLDKGIIVLSIEGCKNTEIAEVMGMSATNVSTRLNRIKEQLKSSIII